MAGNSFEPEKEFLKADELAMAEAITAFIEELNNGQIPDPASFARNYPNAQQSELEMSLRLLAAPRKASVTPDVNTAWQNFSARVFTVPATETVSLGNYVAQALDQKDPELTASKLSVAALEAMKQDDTPLTALRGYQLNDYADLAKRYGVKDAAFPRMLKWLKNAAKSFSSNPGALRGVAFARPAERQQELSEKEIAAALEDEIEEK